MPILPTLPRLQLRRTHKIIHATRDKGHARRLMAILLLQEECTVTDVHHLTRAAHAVFSAFLHKILVINAAAGVPNYWLSKSIG